VSIGPQQLGVVEEAVSGAALAYDSAPCDLTAATGRALAKMAGRGAAGANGEAGRQWLRAHARALVLEAHAEHHQGLPAEAAATLDRAYVSAQRSGDGPTEAHVWALRARIADRAGQHADAVRMAVRGQRLAPFSPTALLLAVKTEAGAWAALGNADKVQAAVGRAMATQRRLGEAWGAPRGFSLLDEGYHPQDVALSAAAALAVAGLPAGEHAAAAMDGVDGYDALALRSAARVVAARVALARGAHDEAAELVVQAARISETRPADWLAREVVAVGRRCRTAPDDLTEAIGAAEAMVSRVQVAEL
jgi:tetratricopeptide (TPR) repeat protein